MLDYLVSVLLGDPSVPPSYRSMRTTMLVAYATLVAAIFAEVAKHTCMVAGETPWLEKWLAKSATDHRRKTVHTTSKLGE